jgi:hypothetical protein
MKLAAAEIERIGIVDDELEARESYEYAVADADLEAVSMEGPLPNLLTFVEDLPQKADAVLCDHHLSVKNYANFTGAALVASCYDRRFPAVLCTDWEDAQIDLIRPYRPRIPALIRPHDLTPESLTAGLEIFLKEINGEWTQERKPWRTQILVVDEDGGNRDPFYVEIPGWSSDEVVRLTKNVVGLEVREHLRTGQRFHAKVNIGADRQEELFFLDWEPS